MIRLPKHWDFDKSMLMLLEEAVDEEYLRTHILFLTKTAYKEWVQRTFPKKPTSISLFHYIDSLIHPKKYTRGIPNYTVYCVYFKDIDLYKFGKTCRTIRQRLYNAKYTFEEIFSYKGLIAEDAKSIELAALDLAKPYKLVNPIYLGGCNGESETFRCTDAELEEIYAKLEIIVEEYKNS